MRRIRAGGNGAGGGGGGGGSMAGVSRLIGRSAQKFQRISCSAGLWFPFCVRFDGDEINTNKKNKKKTKSIQSINQSKTKESKSRNGGKPTRDGTEWESKKKEERERERNKKRSNEKREKGRTAKKKKTATRGGGRMAEMASRRMEI